jgi:imidazolonepropionase-like amidohydrolase
MIMSGGLSEINSDPMICGFTQAEVLTAIDEAHRHKRKVSAHIYGGDMGAHAIAAGLDTVEHGVYLKERELSEMARRGTFLVVTYGPIEAAARLPEVPKHHREKAAQALAQYPRTIAMAHRAGVRLAVGSDTMHADIATEVHALIAAGIPPVEAIRAATKNGADLCGLGDRLGTIQSGKLADLVGVVGNPLENADALDKAVFVMLDGRVVVGPRSIGR